MKKYNLYLMTATLITAFSLSACGTETKKTLGLERAKPDEFAVYRRAPLTLPPDYKLTPPQPGAQRPQESNTTEQAKSIITQIDHNTPTTAAEAATEPLKETSAAEQGFLMDIKSAQANPNIRTILNDEYGLEGNDPTEEKTAVQKLFGVGESDEIGTPINPKEEAKKLLDQGIKAPQPIELEPQPKS